MTEAQLEKKCRKYAKDNGCWLAKWVSPGTAGVPDDILFVPGHKYTTPTWASNLTHVVLVEFKREGKTATKLQQHYLDKLTAMGFEAVVIDNFEDFKALI